MQSTEQAQHDGFDQELLLHVAFGRADGHANADLAGALGYRNQHDIHDADTADKERDLAIEASSMVKTSGWSARSAMSARLRTMKSSSYPVRMRWRSRSSASICCWRCSWLPARSRRP